MYHDCYAVDNVIRMVLFSRAAQNLTYSKRLLNREGNILGNKYERQKPGKTELQ